MSIRPQDLHDEIDSKRLRNPARISPESIRREHMADIGEAERQGRQIAERRHGQNIEGQAG